MKTTALLLLLSGLFLFPGCQRKGCQDSRATNYDEKADEDDGGCIFEGKGVLWYNKSTADDLAQNGHNTLTFVINGKVVGTTTTQTHWDNAPVCNSPGTMTITQSLGGMQELTLLYEVWDQDSVLVRSGSFDVQAAECSSKRI